MNAPFFQFVNLFFSVMIVTRIALFYLFAESKIVRIEENQRGQVLDIRIKLEDQKWNRTSRIKVDLVKKNLTKLYHSRHQIIQEICQKEMENHNELLLESNKLHG